MATITAAAGGGNWTDGASWVGGVAPTSADDALITGTSGNMTWNTGSVCRSYNFTGFTGTLTHNASVTVNVGDGTAGLGNIAGLFSSGMTYTKGSTTTCVVAFVSTNATQQTVTFDTKIAGDVTFNGVGGSWILGSNLSMTDDLTHSAGTFDAGGYSISRSGAGDADFIISGTGVKTTNLSSSSIGLRLWNVSGSNLTFNAGTSQITTDSITSNQSLSFYDVFDLAGNNAAFSLIGTAGHTFNNLSVTNSSEFSRSGNFTVTNTLTIKGLLTDRLIINSQVSIGSAKTITAANVVAEYCDFQDTIGAGAFGWDLSGITGGAGDAGNNTGITFTAPANQYGVGIVGTTTNWGATNTWASSSGGTAGTGRIPLPQDTAIIDANSGSGTRLNLNVARLAKDITWDKSAIQLNFNYTGGTDTRFYGSLNIISAASIIGVTAVALAGNGSHTVNLGGLTASSAWSIEGSGTYTLAGNFASTNNFSINNGAFAGAGYSISVLRFIGATTGTSVNVDGSSIVLNATTTTTIWNINSAVTFSGIGSTITVGTTSTSTRTFAGGGKTYGIVDYSITASTGQLTITGSNPYTTWNISPASGARTVLISSTTSQTFMGTFNVNGTSGNLVSLIGVAGGGAETVSKASGIVSCDWLSITNVTASGGATWYAGANSTDGGGNVGWIFAAAPSTGYGLLKMII